MKNKTILEIHQDLINKKYTIEKMTNEYINKIKYFKDVKKDNVFLYTDFENAINKSKELDKHLEQNKDNLLYGICCTLKDNIVVANQITTGGSLFLKNYISPYSATIVNDINDANSIILSKVALDEFGFGGTGLYSAYGIIKNPIDETRITGGSSSGTAVSVYNGTCSYSIGTDTGDSIRMPAHYLGLTGFKPSYGVISRYGVIPFASSLDHLGVIANDVTDIAIVMDSIAKFDKNDYTSIQLEKVNFYESLNLNVKPKIAILEDAFNYVDENIKNEYFEFLKKLESKFNVEWIKFGEKLIKIIPSVYKTIATTEGLSNISSMTGITFGNHENIDYKNYKDLAIKSRSKYFGKELIKRHIIGAYLSSEENFENVYLKAVKIRNIIVNRADEILKNFDVILVPGGSNTAPLIEDVLNFKSWSTDAENPLEIANFGGMPSITIPLSVKNNLPFGINLMGKKYDDVNVVNIAYVLENFIKGLY
ncbi:MAG: Asp-tRNA(Asn)/Glu-tRNA(Gln) amidotransferase subunit GatA [Candidatus Ureaplasma intestinipullorum]|uniref:Asp-tRNA(Asn)/Glu-tRNA(Gln) amidotransferase subunit GatA n=1 Tax=Candidatus Ureaplasma intestinipullorum TaxID=2838770 RepID=A0A9E2KWV0_9BACT|nr:Asp-tRNA(Asn)/Glu-tRNA(Gln) amidotransferase subunit GatA [Candidatus Ureaplasma intestinipullorum]